MNTFNLITAVQMNKLYEHFELDYDENGYLHALTSKTNNCPILAAQFCNQQCITKQEAIFLAGQLVDMPIIKTLLKTDSFNMKMSEIRHFVFGYRVTFQQMANYNKTALPIRGGAIYIAINTKGQIFSLSSTLQHGEILPLSQSIICESTAIAIANARCKENITSSHVKFMFGSHNNQIKTLYEVTLYSKFPYQSYTYLVLANTGEIINEFSKKVFCRFDNTASGIKAEALLLTPDPDLPISDQISSTIINGLPDTQILKNSYFELFTGTFAKIVYAKDDGTFCYDPRNPEFAAVSVFLSLQKQIELYLSLGLRPPRQPMFVVVDDPFLNDNAYFDPQRYEIHIGVGSGVKHGGLTKHIAFDLSVANHEFGHAVVSLQVPGGDLIGKLGEAINEAIGDVLGALVMDYLGRIWYAKALGQSFDAKALEEDSRIIGEYALPPFGIRCLKNSKRIPDDISGEPHADGLIVGGALADLLVAIATKGKSLEKQIQLYVKVTLMALALLPSYKVTFTDLLRAMITADKELCSGKYRSVIEQCFSSHGIVLDTIKIPAENNLPKNLAVVR